MSRGDKYSEQVEKFYNENLNFFNKTSVNENPELKELLEKCLENLILWNNSKVLKYINIAAYLQDVTSKSQYMSGDFKIAFPLVLKGLQKKKIKVDADSEIIFSYDTKDVKHDNFRSSTYGDVSSSTYNKYIYLGEENDKALKILLAEYSTGSAYARF